MKTCVVVEGKEKKKVFSDFKPAIRKMDTIRLDQFLEGMNRENRIGAVKENIVLFLNWYFDHNVSFDITLGTINAIHSYADSRLND